MDEGKQTSAAACRTEAHEATRFREQLPEIVEQVIRSCNDETCYTHVDYEPIPSRIVVIELLERLREVLFPGYFSREKIDPVNLKYNLGQKLSSLFDLLSEQITLSFRHDCFRYELPCSECEKQGNRISLELLKAIPSIRQVLATDVVAAYEGDPAASSYDEIILIHSSLEQSIQFFD